MTHPASEGPKGALFNKYQFDIYNQGLQGTLPSISTNLNNLEAKAKAKLSPEKFAYIAGGASTGSTNAANLAAFKKYSIVPRMLHGNSVTDFSASITLFSNGSTPIKLSSPIICSPIGVQSLADPQGKEIAAAKGAAAAGITYTLSTAASSTLEEVGDALKEAGGEGWYQLYWPGDDNLTESLLTRAKEAGFKVLVVTLDTWTLGWRPEDLDAAYVPFLLGEGNAVGWSDPVFIRDHLGGLDPRRPEATQAERVKAAIAWIQQSTGGKSKSWDDVASCAGTGTVLLSLSPFLRGIQHPADALKAAELGVDGILCSNHGGRQVDGAIASLDALERISAVLANVPNKPSIIFDSGIRSGADIWKALCLGADAVCVGRPFIWGLALGGQDGVRDVFKSLLADFQLNASLAGYKSVQEASLDCLVKNS